MFAPAWSRCGPTPAAAVGKKAPEKSRRDCGGILKSLAERSALGELGSAAGGAPSALRGADAPTASPLARQPAGDGKKPPAAPAKKLPPHWAAVDISGSKSALAELGSATGSLEAVLNSFERRFSLVFRAFPAFQCSVVLFLNQGKWCIFNQHPAS